MGSKSRAPRAASRRSSRVSSSTASPDSGASRCRRATSSPRHRPRRERRARSRRLRRSPSRPSRPRPCCRRRAWSRVRSLRRHSRARQLRLSRRLHRSHQSPLRSSPPRRLQRRRVPSSCQPAGSFHQRSVSEWRKRRRLTRPQPSPKRLLGGQHRQQLVPRAQRPNSHRRRPSRRRKRLRQRHRLPPRRLRSRSPPRPPRELSRHVRRVLLRLRVRDRSACRDRSSRAVLGRCRRNPSVRRRPRRSGPARRLPDQPSGLAPRCDRATRDDRGRRVQPRLDATTGRANRTAAPPPSRRLHRRRSRSPSRWPRA